MRTALSVVALCLFSPGLAMSQFQTWTCSNEVVAAYRHIGPAGGRDRFVVSTVADCGWVASTDSSFIHPVGAWAAFGAGRVEFEIEANTGPNDRYAWIVVASSGPSVTGLPSYETVTIHQEGAGDEDRDGLPTTWEVRYGLDPNDGRGINGPDGDPDADGRSNRQEFDELTHPRGFYEYSLGEGAPDTAGFSFGFSEFTVSLLNVGAATSAHVLLRARRLFDHDLETPHWVLVPPLSVRAIDLRSLPELDDDEFWLTVESDQALSVDRVVALGAPHQASHAETSQKAARVWYLAEGATHSGFQLWYYVQNPNATAVDVEIRFLLPSGTPVQKTYRLEGHDWKGIWVNDIPELASADLAAVLTSPLPIVVERRMSLGSGAARAVHASAGVSTLAVEWTLAEGATGPYFDTFILVANPNDTAAEVRATFMLPDGTSVDKNYTVAANMRFNIWVDAEDARLADTAFSTVLTSTNGVPIVVERAMWWPGPTAATWMEGHCSAGLTTTGRTWAMAAGESGGPWETETYLLIANNGGAETARVTLYFEDGSNQSADIFLRAKSRTNVPVGYYFPGAIGRRYGAIVDASGADAQIVVEWAQYANSETVAWAAGSSAAANRIR